ncbi:hypothetical protein L21SP5_01717 [Salinivirga cyanobacteriivorans]|uniref:DUF1573 domain-containing protein n=1 Tax=Salinivirga cyanobacteriivorans TaxID=1307839 RepID=A0A0S2HZ76_9BACT|nr:DUF1573 domain-containing protein [Salinivirga cyanobacteriivorans]ALO15359.1 hypothetical protein L21SP5_01717 [Salinivirga cyanobacteriivorans]
MRFFLFILIITIISACQHFNKDKQKLTKVEKKKIFSQVYFKNKYQDFGVLPQDTTVSAEFYFKNTGKNKLIVDYVNPDCTCTGYEVSKDTIAVGDSAFIRLDFNTKHKYGKQKIYTIVSMNTQEELYKLMFTADVQ